jgi:23S rRNA (uracil1939-C5)-methyltransferase
MTLKKNDILDLDITGYAFEGKGISKINTGDDDSDRKYVIFVNGTYPGDKVSAKLIKVKKSYAEAICENIHTPSENRIEAHCHHFGTCGGCKQQNLNYESQLFYKDLQVKETFEHIGGISDYIREPIIGSENIFYYRNKMEFSFADKRWLTHDEINDDEIIDRCFALGLHIPRIFDKVLDIKECYLQSETSSEIVNFTRDFFKSRGTSIYNTKIHTGFLRNLVIKQSHHTNDLMVNLVTSEENGELLTEYTKKLVEKFPGITTVINNINLRMAQVATGDYEIIFFGDGYIFDTIGKFKYRISANSFFQTNTLHAVNLYEKALEYADLKGNEIVYDLYSGAGTISIFVAEKSKEVYAFESVEPAVNDAEYNSEQNGINNITFIQADLNSSFLPIIKTENFPNPDVVIADPPRSGMNPKTVDDLLHILPGKIIYVSCNPATQARDIEKFVTGGYKLIKTCAVDMFPHTYHIENVALLIKE